MNSNFALTFQLGQSLCLKLGLRFSYWVLKSQPAKGGYWMTEEGCRVQLACCPVQKVSVFTTAHLVSLDLGKIPFKSLALFIFSVINPGFQLDTNIFAIVSIISSDFIPVFLLLIECYVCTHVYVCVRDFFFC